MELGRFLPVSLREKWINEARDFTPWISENIIQLNEALGLELSVENIEVAVGPYSADILARDTGTGKYVVIENQLEKTNHDHLGKALTYASVLDASTVIWIATQFTEEHKKALDWLNDHTTEEISFYGVQVELWKIDDSKPAVRFHVVSNPVQTIRQAAKAKAGDDLTESKKFQLEFWTQFSDALAKTKQVPSVQKPRAQYWYDVSLGRSNIHLSNTCNTWEGKVGIRVYIANKIADKMYPFLESQKDKIEQQLGMSLTWNPNPDNKDKIVSITHHTDFKDKGRVDEAIKWLTDNTIKFRDTFSRIIKEAP
jgi:hypothetical protein